MNPCMIFHMVLPAVPPTLNMGRFGEIICIIIPIRQMERNPTRLAEEGEKVSRKTMQEASWFLRSIRMRIGMCP